MRAELELIAGRVGLKCILNTVLDPAGRLVEAFGADAGRLSLDDFYLDLSHQLPEERHRTNFDHPNAIDWPLFRRTLARIRRRVSR